MKNYSYYVYTIESNGKYFSTWERVHNSNNLLSYFNKIKGLKHINACSTLKECKEIAESWNKACKENGTFLF